jgi:hypothetical protein
MSIIDFVRRRSPDELEDAAFLKSSALVLERDFPNPERVGCPDIVVLRQIARRQLSLTEAEKWMNHLGACSECFKDFEKQRRAIQVRSAVTFAGALAALVLLGGILVTVLVRSHGRELVRHKDVQNTHELPIAARNTHAEFVPFELDMREAAQVRGVNSKAPVRKLPRKALHLFIYLPLGSDTGSYSVDIKRKDQSVWSTATTAQFINKRISAQFDIDLSAYAAGHYQLELSSTQGLRLRQDLELE